MIKELDFGSDELLKIMNIFKENNAKARIIGGAVRDKLLGLSVSDIDIATNFPPEEVTEIFEAEKYKVIPTGINHGTVTIYVKGRNFEVTTLRKDIETDGRWAKIEFTDCFEEDASRRDFTINALSYDIFEKKIYDYFGGIRDLENRIVRFIGNPEERIKEDYLRILRFFRFSGRFSGHLEQEGLNAIKNNIDGLAKVSKERINSELTKIFKFEKNISNLLIEMEKSKLFKIFAPEFDLDFTGILNFETKSEEIILYKPDLLSLRLLFLTFSTGRRGVLDFLKHMKFSNKEQRIIHIIYDFTSALISLENKKDIYFEICKFWYYNKENIKEALLISYILELITKEELDSNLKSMKNEAPKIPVNSSDLIELGYEGLRLGIRKKYLEHQWIKSGFSVSKEELIKL